MNVFKPVGRRHKRSFKTVQQHLKQISLKQIFWRNPSVNGLQLTKCHSPQGHGNKGGMNFRRYIIHFKKHQQLGHRHWQVPEEDKSVTIYQLPSTTDGGFPKYSVLRCEVLLSIFELSLNIFISLCQC